MSELLFDYIHQRNRMRPTRNIELTEEQMAALLLEMGAPPSGDSVTIDIHVYLMKVERKLVEWGWLPGPAYKIVPRDACVQFWRWALENRRE